MILRPGPYILAFENFSPRGMMRICPKCRALYPDYANVCPQDGNQLTQQQESDPLVGATLNDSYIIMDKIGEGGMGAVYKARHRVLEKMFAIKVLRKEFAQDSDATQRFVEEAKATSSIGHENIIDVTDFGTTPDGSLYIVMEHLPGENLAELTKREGALDIGRCINIWKQIAAALGAAHANGIIHRDLKSENILLAIKGDKKDLVKVLDFGIAKIISGKERGVRQTSTGMVLGTPAFMSPEQASGAVVDTRTDIYSLGVIMYETATGRLPFDHQNPLTILIMHQTDAVPSMRSIRAQIPGPVEQTILKCLQKSKDLRFKTMEELHNALDAAEKGVVSFPDSNLTPVKSLSKDEIDKNRVKLFANPGDVWYDPFEKPSNESAAPKKTAPAPKQSPEPRSVPGANPSLELARAPEEVKRKTQPERRDSSGFSTLQLRPKKHRPLKPLVYGLAIGASLFMVVWSYFLRDTETPVVSKHSVAVTPAAKPKAPPGDMPSLDAIQDEAAEANDMIRARRFEEAVQKYRELIGIRPTFAPLHKGLGNALEKTGDTAGAVEAYRRYLELAPQAADSMEIQAYINQYGRQRR